MFFNTLPVIIHPSSKTRFLLKEVGWGAVRDRGRRGDLRSLQGHIEKINKETNHCQQTFLDNLELPVCLACVFLDCGSEQEHPEREPWFCL